MNYTPLTPDSPELQSLSLIHGNLAALQQLFPSVVREGKVDFDALRQLLGDDVAKDDELYGLQWHGKARARRNALTPSLGTLRPCKAESKNWDSTQNLYIEGDNLEVLKLLQKSYAGKVKMIYIDPPYNTGKEFVYPDNYQNGIEHYLKLTGQTDSFKANAETGGRYHTDWLNMMYPRLMLARELLSDDGVIFISIDDNEMVNLKEISDEILGEDNFIANMVWKSKSGGANDSKYMAVDHEYILCYAKNANRITQFLDNDATITTSYNFSDEKGEYSLERLDKQSIRYSPSLDYAIIGPDNKVYTPKHKNPKHPNATWRWSRARVEENFDDLVFKNGCVYTKNYKKECNIARSMLIEDKFGRTRTGKTDFTDLFQIAYFSSPKPIKLVYYLANIILTKDALILDFFSGSATTAHAVMQLNAEDGGNRRFIMVQLPEACVEGSEAAKAGYKNICEIGKERIRRAGEKVKEEAGEKAEGLDIGFRVFKLDSSNVKPWNTEAGMLNMQLEQESNLRPERSSEDIFYEVLLKQGIELTEDCHTREVAGHRVYSLGYGQYYCCFDERIGDEAQELAAGIALWHAEEDPDGQSCVVYVRDSAFDSADLIRGTQGDEGDARKKSFCLTLEQSNIMQVKAI